MAWRMPPAFYAKPRMESALEGLLLFGYAARAAASVNCGVLALLGVFFRALTYLALIYTNRDRMGLRAPAHAFADLYAALRPLEAGLVKSGGDARGYDDGRRFLLIFAHQVY